MTEPEVGLRELRKVRAEAQDGLMALPNVVGTGLGVKRRAGIRVSGKALIVYVSDKQPRAALKAAEAIPSSLSWEGRSIPTDVVPLRQFRYELGEPPLFTNDHARAGTVTAYGKTDTGYCLVTCAHCLGGPDGNVYTPHPVRVFDHAAGVFVACAMTVTGVFSAGSAISGKFGRLDAGYAELSDPNLLARAAAAGALDVSPPRVSTLVYGEGPKGRVKGVVDAVETIVTDVDGAVHYIDQLIRLIAGGTTPGYSGMLWRTASGKAVAMHFGGFYEPGADSDQSASTSIARVAKALQLILLDAG